MKFTALLIIVVVVFTIIGCESTTETENQVETKIATLIWDNPAADGCGFFLEFNKKRYKPINEDFIYNNLDNPYPSTVEIKFKNLNRKIEYVCGFSGPQKENAIELFSISPQ